MASDYGLNFGFRRSDESLRVAEGRYRTPATGSLLQLGTAVTIDPADATKDHLKVAPADSKPLTGVTGLLVQEEIWDRSWYEAEHVDSFALGVAKANRLSVITNGPGVKVWFKNTLSQTRADSRVIPAVTMFNTVGADTTALAVGVGMKWDGTHWDPIADPSGATSFGVVTFYDATAKLVELVLTH